MAREQWAERESFLENGNIVKKKRGKMEIKLIVKINGTLASILQSKGSYSSSTDTFQYWSTVLNE